MTTVTADISISLDGFVAGPNQSEELPFGEGVDGRLHTWAFDHADENQDEIDPITSAGAYIMGRNMFGPGRGEWDLEWKGWWGPEPPYHAPVFVLTHHPREPLEMDGGTTFTFVTDGPESALAQARRAAGNRAGGDRGRGGHAQPVPVTRRDRRIAPARRAHPRSAPASAFSMVSAA
jgi:dihydrofolate reductase